MGFFSNLRAAGTISLAAAFIDKHLRLQAEAGRFRGDPRRAGEAMVKALWASIPALVEGGAKPKPVLLAAASLATGLYEAERAGNRQLSDVLHSALQLLLLHDAQQLVDVEAIAGIDSQLFDLAHSVFEKDNT